MLGAWVAAAALGTHDAAYRRELAAKCTGAKPPLKQFPACYQGGTSVLGMKEAVKVRISTFHLGNRTGLIDIDASGISPEHCRAVHFNQTGQVITLDPVVKYCLSGTSVNALYCSDQDVVQLNVAIPHFPTPSIPVALASAPCE